jgi:hypothetical protein
MFDVGLIAPTPAVSPRRISQRYASRRRAARRPRPSSNATLNPGDTCVQEKYAEPSWPGAIESCAGACARPLCWWCWVELRVAHACSQWPFIPQQQGHRPSMRRGETACLRATGCWRVVVSVRTRRDGCSTPHKLTPAARHRIAQPCSAPWPSTWARQVSERHAPHEMQRAAAACAALTV